MKCPNCGEDIRIIIVNGNTNNNKWNDNKFNHSISQAKFTNRIETLTRQEYVIFYPVFLSLIYSFPVFVLLKITSIPTKVALSIFIVLFLLSFFYITNKNNKNISNAISSSPPAKKDFIDITIKKTNVSQKVGINVNAKLFYEFSKKAPLIGASTRVWFPVFGDKQYSEFCSELIKLKLMVKKGGSAGYTLTPKGLEFFDAVNNKKQALRVLRD